MGNTIRTTGGLTVGELITLLEGKPKDMPVVLWPDTDEDYYGECAGQLGVDDIAVMVVEIDGVALMGTALPKGTEVLVFGVEASTHVPEADDEEDADGR